MSKSLVFNKIPLKKIEIGMSVSYSQTVTDSDIKKFAEISGDRNPVHLEEVFAENSRYKKRIVCVFYLDKINVFLSRHETHNYKTIVCFLYR